MDEVGIDKLARVYIKIREEKARLTKEYDTALAQLDAQHEAIESKLLEHCAALGATSIKTPHGTVIRQEKTRFWAADWAAFGQYVVDNNAPDLLEKRIAQTRMKEYLESLPEGSALPPSIQADRKYVAVVRKSS